MSLVITICVITLPIVYHYILSVTNYHLFSIYDKIVIFLKKTSILSNHTCSKSYSPIYFFQEFGSYKISRQLFPAVSIVIQICVMFVVFLQLYLPYSMLIPFNPKTLDNRERMLEGKGGHTDRLRLIDCNLCLKIISGTVLSPN